MFRSILFHESEADTVADGRAMPECMPDLNLDQIISSITNGRDEYNLKPFFYTALHHVEAINYRHDILRNLENPAVRGYIDSFAVKMRAMRGRLAVIEKLYYRYEKARWFLDAADIYCDAIICLSHDLDLAVPRSSGFLAFRQYLISYLESPRFTSLLSETQKLTTDLADIRYCLHIKGNRIKVSRYGAESDYGAEVLNTFEKFKQGAVKEYRFDVSSGGYMNHVEAAVLDLVARLFPDIFRSLDQYVTRHGHYLDDTIRTFDREIQFYIACLDYIAPFKPVGLHFCYPIVTNQSKELYGHETFDLALANKLVHDNGTLVTNDFYLTEPERILVVSGPNQGGKTTFARTFGQLHYLASIGYPVPGTEAKLFLFDQLFTHFEKHEDLRNLSSKLEHDLRRIHAILEQATSGSILIMNESFASTTLNDALFLNTQIMQEIIWLDMLCVSVTFLDELASLSETTVSMVSTLDPNDQAKRTFKIVRQPADGLAYAMAIAEKYHVTYASIKERIKS